jgi:hypothetical protein
MKEQVQVDHNDEQKLGEIIGELKGDVKQNLSNKDTLTRGGRSYKDTDKDKEWSEMKCSEGGRVKEQRNQ